MSASKPPVFALVAGELSGDLLGADLIRALRVHYPDARFIGVAGPRMLAEGAETLFPMERLSIMGITEVLPRLPELFRYRRQLVDWFVREQPLACIGIDAPDFNLRVAQKLHQHGLSTVHYASPTVWAWRQGRVKGIRACIDLMLAFYPFEADFYREHDVPVACVGHPMADGIPMEPDRGAARQALGLSNEAPVVALLPGSRFSEIEKLLPDFLGAATLIQQRYPNSQLVLASAGPGCTQQIEKILTRHPVNNIQLVENDSRQIMTAADVILLASGTAALEAMLLKRPMVVAYRVSPLTYTIVRWLATVDMVSMPNLLAGQALAPEFLQKAVKPEALSDAVGHWLDNPDAVAKVTRIYREMHQQLRGEGARYAARAIVELVNKNNREQ